MHKLMMLVAAKWREFMAMASKEDNDPNNFEGKEKEQLQGYEEIRGEEVAQKEEEYDTDEGTNTTITEANGKHNLPSLDQTKTMEVRAKNIGSLIPRDFYPIYRPASP